jgi:hypothetical protein
MLAMSGGGFGGGEQDLEVMSHKGALLVRLLGVRYTQVVTFGLKKIFYQKKKPKKKNPVLIWRPGEEASARLCLCHKCHCTFRTKTDTGICP